MTMIKNDFETEVKQNYKVLLAGKERTFSKVVLTKSPFGNKMSLTASELKRLSYFTTLEICLEDSQMSVEELEFMRRLFELTQGQIAEVLKRDAGTISKWKKNHENIGYPESMLLKVYFKRMLNSMAASKLSKLEQNLIQNQVALDSFSILSEVKSFDDLYCTECVKIAFDKVTTKPRFELNQDTYRIMGSFDLEEQMIFEEIPTFEINYDDELELKEFKHAVGGY